MDNRQKKIERKIKTKKDKIKRKRAHRKRKGEKPTRQKRSPKQELTKQKHIWDHLNTATGGKRRSAYADAGETETRHKSPTGTNREKARKTKD